MKIYNKDNPKILNDFLDYLLMIKNYSENTVKAYQLDLLCFFDFIKRYLGLNVSIKDFNIFVLLDVKESDIIAFLVFLNFSRNNTGSTRQRKLSAVKRFYKWLICSFPSSNRMDPTQNIPNIRQALRLPKYLSLKQANKMCSVFTVQNCIYPQRNNVIVSLFLNTGLRLSELVNINVCDINFEEKYIRIVSKRNKERKVFINENTKRQLLTFIKSQNKNKAIMNINRPLFVGHQHKRLGIDGVARVCKKAFELMGLKGCGYTTHSLRHTFASLMYNSTNDVLLVKELLGHSCIEATEVYIHIDDKSVRDAVDRNPLNNFEKVA